MAVSRVGPVHVLRVMGPVDLYCLIVICIGSAERFQLLQRLEINVS